MVNLLDERWKITEKQKNKFLNKFLNNKGSQKWDPFLLAQNDLQAHLAAGASTAAGL